MIGRIVHEERRQGILASGRGQTSWFPAVRWPPRAGQASGGDFSITRRPGVTGFTLIEVILAIVIALGVLLVLLYFYEQATNLRAQAIQETERISAARLLMDRITGELRSAQIEPSFGQGLIGSSNSIQFVKTDVPSFASWTGGRLGRSAVPLTDLKVISYRLDAPDGTNVAGLLRSEEPLVVKRQLLASEEDTVSVSTNATPNANALPVIEEIRFLQFRYWSGTNWIDSWNSTALPEGVEVSLGAEPATNGVDLAEYPAEVFRRVICLPAHGLAQTTAEPKPPGEKVASPTEVTP